MSAPKLTSSTRSRRGLIAATALLPALAAGATWLRSAEPIETAPAQAQAAAAPAAPQQAVAPPAPAATPARAAMAPTSSTPQPSVPATVAPAVSGQRAYIDPKTGRLREAEHDDAATLDITAAAPRRTLRTAGAAAPAQVFGPGGAEGVAVPEDLLTFTVATRMPDGRVVIQHATGPKDARAKAQAGSRVGPVGGKEEHNDR